MTLTRHLLALLLALTMLLGMGRHGWAEDSPDDIARQIKAAYLIKFANYVEWPSNTFDTPDSPIVIGIIGADPLADELERVTMRRPQIGNRPIVVERLSVQDTAAKVHILYIGRRSGPKLREWLQALGTQPMLSVSDASHELSSETAIKFVLDNNRLRFDVSVPEAERSGVKIAAPLLTVARRLEE